MEEKKTVRKMEGGSTRKYWQQRNADDEHIARLRLLDRRAMELMQQEDSVTTKLAQLENISRKVHELERQTKKKYLECQRKVVQQQLEQLELEQSEQLGEAVM